MRLTPHRLRAAFVTMVLVASSMGVTAPASIAGPLAPVPQLLLPSAVRAPNGWTVRPAGTQVLTQRAPTGITVTPDGRTVLAVSSGFFDEHLAVIDAATLLPVLSPTTDLWQGVAADAAGNVWASGGSRNRVFQYRLVGPVGVPLRHVGPVPGTPNLGIKVIGYPGNMVLGPDGRLFVAGNLSVPSAVIAGAGGPACASSTVCSPVNIVDVSDPLARKPVVRVAAVGRDAFGLALNPALQRLYVANWADGTNPARAGGAGTVSVVDVTPGHEREVQVVAVGKEPTGVALSADGVAVAVLGSGDDSLTMLRTGADGSVVATKTWSLRVRGDAPAGTTPAAVAFGPDGLLYIAMAGLNAVEVRTATGAPIAQSVPGPAGPIRVPHTWIPTGWYPDTLALAPAPSGAATRLYVANLKGMSSGPGLYPQTAPIDGSRTEGSVSAIDIPQAGSARDAAFAAWTAQVVANDELAPLFDPTIPDPASDPCRALPLPGGGSAASTLLCAAARGTLDPRSLHVVVVFNENKTFDSMLGDLGMPGVDASAAFAEFGKAITPNHHRLAKQFTVADSFYSDGESSTQGHDWATWGNDPLYNELTWSTEYDENLRGNRLGGQYDGQIGGPSDATVRDVEQRMHRPPLRLVDMLATPSLNPAGATEAIYSDDVNPGSPAHAFQPPLGLWGLGSQAVGGKDLTFPDTDRAAMFLHGETISHAWNLLSGPPPATFGKPIAFSDADKERYTVDGWSRSYTACRSGGGTDAACQTAMPNFVYMVMPEDHTYVINDGFNPLNPTPQAEVASNDLGVGQVAEGLSRSPFWNHTLFLVTEDDTQFTGDHVDTHRTYLLAAGGLATRLGPAGRAAHQPASYPAMLKTIEVLLHLQPMSLFDWRAAPMQEIVADAVPTNAPGYRAVRPLWPFLGDTVPG